CDVCCGCLSKNRHPKSTSTDSESVMRFLDSPETELNFCSSAFLPKIVRNIIKEKQLSLITDDTTPFNTTFTAIVLTCIIPEIAEGIEFYSMNDDFSVDVITEELNAYVTNVMKVITNEGGDIIYIEDGVLHCLWHIEHANINQVSDHVLRLALYLQTEFGDTKRMLGQKLRNQIGIATGELNMLFVGLDTVYFVSIGEAVKESVALSKLCGKGEVVASPSFWKNLDTAEDYKWQVLSDDSTAVYSSNKAFIPVDNSKEGNLELLQIYDAEIGDFINRYLHPLYKNVRTKQQLQILSSMAQLVVIVTKISDMDLKEPDSLQDATLEIQAIVQEYEGKLMNIIYNGDVLFIILFGYPGFTHTDDAVRSILCSQKIVKSLKSLNLKVSIGISTGLVFCGVLGPPLRQECCVLGMSVHIALTLVEQFQDWEMVCCINTFFRTRRMVGEIFTPLRKRMRAVRGASVFFHVHSEIQIFNSSAVKCIGRSAEKKMITDSLKEIKKGMDELDVLMPLINIRGKMGLGKTTLLKWALQEASKVGFKFIIPVNNHVFEETYDNAWSIVNSILQQCLMDTEEKILASIGKDAEKFPLYLLNKHLNTSVICSILPI
ncbi:adenylate cyclase type 10-like, partial [Stegodyphus dumicola]|uniref:adenylate cyclase type 10-like n=1 Tax=Stegodyphus dumicola TaxID=202533 RepID=UPI0015ACA8EA